MRDIKFRAFQDGKMLYQDASGVYGTKKFFDGLYEDCVLMQYTGLKDRKGKEIFDGDIVKFDVAAGYREHEKQQRHQKGIVTCPHLGQLQFGCWHSEYCGNIEIIGNFYENLELLNEEKTL